MSNLNKQGSPYLLNRQRDESQNKRHPSQRPLGAQKLISAAELDCARAFARLGVGKDVLKVPQHVTVSLHVKV